MPKLALEVGYYDPFSVFQGGFREDFVARTQLPQLAFKSPFNAHPLLIKNLNLAYREEMPVSFADTRRYLKFMFVVVQNVDDYRSTVRPLIKQWLSTVKDISPTIPHFIVLFEHTQAKMATDKLLKVSIEAKLKKDFPALDFPELSIFRIKSVYPTNDDKLAVWSNVKEVMKSSIARSIWNKLELYGDDVAKRARVFIELEMYDQASKCYEELFNEISYLRDDQGFGSFKLTEVKSIFDPDLLIECYDTEFDKKLTYFKFQAFMLSNTKLPQVQIYQNLNKLAKLVIGLINSLEMTYRRSEFAIALINEVLALPQYKLIMEQSPNDQQTKIQESITYLLLLKRNEFLKLGGLMRYQLRGAFVEIRLDTEDAQQYEIQSTRIKSKFESLELFATEFMDQTKLVLKRFSKYGNNKHIIASLESEAALILHYNSNVFGEEFDGKTLSYFYDAFQHFSKTGWDKISLPLLEIYIERLEKKIRSTSNPKFSTIETLLASYMKLISLKPSVFKQETLDSYLDLIFKHQEEKSNLTLNIPSLINIGDISSVYCSDVDLYSFDIQLDSQISGLKNKDVVIELSAVDDSKTVLYFACGVEQTSGCNVGSKITVSSSVFVEGVYKITNVFVTIGSKDGVDVIISHEFDMEAAQSVFVHYFPSFQTDLNLRANTQVALSVPSVRWLHKDILDFNVEFGDLKTNITDCTFTFFKVEPDRIVPDSTYSLYLDNQSIEFEFSEDDDKLIFNVKNQSFEPQNCLTLKLPFFFPADITNTKLSLHYSFKYKEDKENGREYIQFQTSHLSTQLKLAAAADEKIKCESIISHYTLNSVQPNLPMCIRNVSLKSNNSVIDSCQTPNDIMVFMDQGSTFFFKIKQLNDSSVDLKIEYTCLLTEITEFVSRSFIKRLLSSPETSDLIRYSKIVNNIWKAIDFKVNRYALTGSILYDGFDISKFDYLLHNLFKPDRIRLTNEIASFVESLTHLAESTPKEDFMDIRSSLKQELWISVPLPAIDIIGTLEYHYEKSLQYLLGEPIKVSIDMKVNAFSTVDVGENPTLGTLEDEFQRKVRFDDLQNNNNSHKIPLGIELAESNPNWVIAGLKDLNFEFEMKKGVCKEYNFELMFIPVKTGRIEVPDVHIKTPQDSKLAIHLDFKNKSEVIHVVNELNTITQVH